MSILVSRGLLPLTSSPVILVGLLLVVCPGGYSIPFLPPSSPLYVLSSLREPASTFLASVLTFRATLSSITSVVKMLGSNSATVALLHLFLLFLGPAFAAPTVPSKRTEQTSYLRLARDGDNLSQSTTVTTTSTLQT